MIPKGHRQVTYPCLGTSLYIGNRLKKILHLQLGPEDKHTIQEAEIVGLLMELHMPKTF